VPVYIGIFEWTLTFTDANGMRVSRAGIDLLKFRGDMVESKNSFSKQRT
jgi:hypothetical protein